MAKKFLEGVNLKSQSRRNGFDVSYQNQFTMPFGMILPHFFQRVNPDDKLKLANETQVICDGLVKPAFMRLKLHLDYYFIPATQLWMPFDNFVTGQNSYFSNLVKNNNDGSVVNRVPTFTLNYLNQVLTDLTADTNVGDDLGYNFAQGSARLFDMLGYFNLTGIANYGFADLNLLNWSDSSEVYNLLPLLCYQKVYYDYFRNVYYEDNITSAYNIDDLKGSQVIDTYADMSLDRFKEIIKVHYRWQKRDYFTQTQPNVLVDGTQIGYTGLQSDIVNGFLNVPGLITLRPNVSDSASTLNAGKYVRTGGMSNVTTPTASTISQNGVSVANIRFAFAYDKLLRRMREAGADFDKQMLAQFGVTPYDARHGKCTYLGGYTNSLNSKDVTNFTGEEIGHLAGQINAYCDNSKKTLKFHAKEHGYVIGVISTSVDNMYQSYRSSRETMIKDRFDWFNPAFENVGKAPLFEIERSYLGSQSGSFTDYDPNTRTSIIGYVPRYSELKTHVDECHGNLCQTTGMTGFKEWNVQLNVGSRGNQPLQRYNMLLDPAMFDSVSGIEYDGSQTRDHFVVNTFNHSRKVSTMSMFETF